MTDVWNIPLWAAVLAAALPGVALATWLRIARGREASRYRRHLARAQGLLDLTQDGVALLSPQGTVLWANARLSSWTTLPRERLSGRDIDTLLPELADFLPRSPSCPTGLPAGLADTAMPPHAWPEGQETRLLRADGPSLPVRLDLHGLPGAPDLPPALVAVMRDLRPERELLRRERQARAELGALLQGGADHLLQLETDALGRITQVNEGLCRWLGRPAATLLGLPCRRLRDRSRPPAFWVALWEGLRLGHAWRGEVVLRDAQSRPRRVDTLLVPLLDEQGRLRRVVLQARTDAATTAATTATTTAGHGAASGPRSPAPTGVPATAPSARPTVATRAVDAHALLRELVRTQEPRARARGVRLSCRGSALAWVQSDAPRLRALLAALLQRVLDRPDPPSRVDAQARLNGAGEVTLSIEDDGPAWAPFDTSPARPGSGAWPAPPALRDAALELGGRLELTRTIGRGSLVRLHLPVAGGLPVAPGGAPPTLVPGPPRRPEVLVVDDDAERLGVLRALLVDRGGWTLREARGTAEAIGQIAARAPDLVLVGVGGATLLRALRADHDTARMPVVALTSAAAARQPAAVNAEGDRFDACVPLPITDTLSFLDTLRACLVRTDREPPTP